MEFATFIFAEEGCPIDECSVARGVFHKHFHFRRMLSIVTIGIVGVIVLYNGIVGFVWKIEKTVHATMTIGYHCVDVIV